MHVCVLYFIVLSAAPLQLHAFAFRRVPGTRDATEIATMADSEAKLAKYFLARQLLEDRLEQALDRVYPETDGEFDGFLHEHGRYFRWARDNQIYHWFEFVNHYGDRATEEWDASPKVMADDQHWVVPFFLLDDE